MIENPEYDGRWIVPLKPFLIVQRLPCSSRDTRCALSQLGLSTTDPLYDSFCWLGLQVLRSMFTAVSCPWVCLFPLRMYLLPHPSCVIIVVASARTPKVRCRGSGASQGRMLRAFKVARQTCRQMAFMIYRQIELGFPGTFSSRNTVTRKTLLLCAVQARNPFLSNET